MIAVCSNKPRPQVQTGRHLKYGGMQRDAWHFRGENDKTLCGINCSEWLVIGEAEPDHDLCDRCRRKLP